jgi:hypothetical protein
MRAFACPHCSALIFFENSVCVTCGSALGFLRSVSTFVQLQPGRPNPLAWVDDDGIAWVPCANNVLATCNWLAPVGAEDGLCSCCALTRTRPNDDDAEGLAAFAVTEAAKRRLLYQLDHLALPTTTRTENPINGLAFDLLSSREESVITGHDHGIITIDLAEGDDPHREALRQSLGEAYRTMLGHLRHEIGHWYWEVLIERSPALPRFRELFGDESVSYADALKEHYGSKGSSEDWRNSYVSDYAASHPWEDWAECFAHYLHMTDTLETAATYGLVVAGPDLDLSTAPDVHLSVTPKEQYHDFDRLLAAWLALTYPLNAINRSMGKDDLYPFVLVPPVIEKLRFVHEMVTASA